MARRALYRALLPFEPRFGCVADVDMWMRFTFVADVAFVDEAMINADSTSHFVQGVNWPLVHSLRSLHAENVERYDRATGNPGRGRWLRHGLTFAYLYLLCAVSLVRRGRWSELAGMLGPRIEGAV
jgi:hypothetical protein